MKAEENSGNENGVGKHLAGMEPDKIDWKDKDEAYWRSVLTPLQYDVARNHGTERAGTGRYSHSKESGMYYCSSCGQQLFSSDKKFDSGTGWPSFYEAIPGSVSFITDNKFGMSRTEVVCSRCGSHLGHVFDDGPKPTGKRFCMNSVSLLHEKDRSGK